MTLLTQLTDPSPDIALGALATLALGAVGAWIAVAVTCGLVAALPGALGRTGRRALAAITPALLRRVLAAAVGTASLAGPAQAALASTPVSLDLPAPGQPAGSVVEHPVALTPKPVVAAPRVVGHLSPPGQPAATTRPEAPRAATVTVRAGDTLWGLVRSSLGPGATDAQVAAAWPHWWQANRDVVGPDPALLVPGQQLHVPGASR